MPRDPDQRGKEKIYTDSDLVNLKRENPTLYQSAMPAETEAFKEWFGDSTVVGENGKNRTSTRAREKKPENNRLKTGMSRSSPVDGSGG